MMLFSFSLMELGVHEIEMHLFFADKNHLNLEKSKEGAFLAATAAAWA